jgi:hypothetical protein
MNYIDDLILVLHEVTERQVQEVAGACVCVWMCTHPHLADWAGRVGRLAAGRGAVSRMPTSEAHPQLPAPGRRYRESPGGRLGRKGLLMYMGWGEGRPLAAVACRRHTSQVTPQVTPQVTTTTKTSTSGVRRRLVVCRCMCLRCLMVP